MRKPQKSEETESDWKKIGPCLYRYKNGVYYGLIKQRGKQIRRSLETEDLELARRSLKTLRQDLERTDPELANRTMDDHAPRFLETIRGAEGTRNNIKRSVANLLADWPKNSPRTIRRIKEGDCRIWLNTYAHLSRATVNQRIGDARDFFELAVTDGVIANSPMKDVTYEKREDVIRLTPTREQFEAIVADLRSQPSNGHGAENSADFVALAGELGLGQAELSGIHRKHINLAGESLQLFRLKTRTPFTIPIFPRARPIIERRLADMPKDPNARLLPYDDCRKGLAGACKRLGFPSFEPRALRRYFITNALRRGVDVPTVAAWQGHTDGGALILRTYADIVREQHSKLMAALLGDEEK